MGQAKARGTQEQRISEGAEKARLANIAEKARLAARAKKDAEYLASLSPEERKKKLTARLMVGYMFGMEASLLNPSR